MDVLNAAGDSVADQLTERLASDLARAITAPFHRAAGDEEDGFAKLADEALKGLDLSAFDDLVGPAKAALEDAGRIGGTAAIRNLRIVAGPRVEDLVLPNDAVVKFATDRSAELVGKRVTADGRVVDNPNAQWAITDGTREQLRGTIVEALREGQTRAELRAAIEDNFAFSRERAETIVRTEVSRALIAGNKATARASGVVKGKRSILSSGHDLDDVCDTNADAGVIPLEDPYPSGDMDAPYHPKCECDELYELTDENDDAIEEAAA